MNASQELIQHINDSSIPDKARILRAKEVAGELVNGISDPARRERMRRSLHDAYLNLQLANLAEDREMVAKCRNDCLSLVRLLSAKGAVEGAGGPERADDIRP